MYELFFSGTEFCSFFLASKFKVVFVQQQIMFVQKQSLLHSKAKICSKVLFLLGTEVFYTMFFDVFLLDSEIVSVNF